MHLHFGLGLFCMSWDSGVLGRSGWNHAGMPEQGLQNGSERCGGFLRQEGTASRWRGHITSNMKRRRELLRSSRKTGVSSSRMSTSTENRPLRQTFCLTERRVSQQKWTFVLISPAFGAIMLLTYAGLSISRGESWYDDSACGLLPVAAITLLMVILTAVCWWRIPVSLGSVRLHIDPDVLRIEHASRQLKEVKLGEITEVIVSKDNGDVVVALELLTSRDRVKLYGWERMNDLMASVISYIPDSSVKIREVPGKRKRILPPGGLALVSSVWTVPFLAFAMSISFGALGLLLALGVLLLLGGGLYLLREWRISGRVSLRHVAIFLGLILLLTIHIVLVLEFSRLVLNSGRN